MLGLMPKAQGGIWEQNDILGIVSGREKASPLSLWAHWLRACKLNSQESRRKGAHVPFHEPKKEQAKDLKRRNWYGMWCTDWAWLWGMLWCERQRSLEEKWEDFSNGYLCRLLWLMTLFLGIRVCLLLGNLRDISKWGTHILSLVR